MADITQNGSLRKDENDYPVMGGTSTVDNVTIINSAFDPVTRRLLTSGSGGSSGTVTSVSVVTANGLAGSVANPTTTPAITLSTTVTGVLKGNGTAISAASPSTDYATLAFKTIAVSGQSDVVADSPIDTLTLVAGTNVTITTDATTDSITINSTGGGSGTPGGLNTQLQYNNAGSFGGITGATTNGTAVSLDSAHLLNPTINGAGVGLATLVYPNTASNATITVPATTGTLALTSQLTSGTVTSVASADGSITVTNPSTTVDLAVVKAPILTTSRTIGTITGDATSAGSAFNGSANNTNALTLATVNSNVGSFTNANITVNAKGLITAAANGTAGLTTLTVGTTTITSGTTTRMLYDNAGVLGETTGITTNGTVATLTTPVINGVSTGTGVAAAATASTLALRDASANLSADNFLQGYTTTATAAGTTTLTVDSTYLQYFTGATTQTVALPVASTLVLGQQFFIQNLASGNITVNSSGGNAVLVLVPGTSAIITCILTSGTAAASWSAYYYGEIITSGKGLNVSNTLTLAGTDGTTMTFPTTSKTIAANDGSNWTFASQAIGDIVTASSTTAYTRIAAVALGAVLTSAGTTTQPTWSTAPQITTIELGNASDTTLSRSAGGVLAVEGVVIPSVSSTNTLTNKRISPRIVATTQAASPAINSDNGDIFEIVALAQAVTSMTTNLTGTPVEGQFMEIIFKDNGTARAITWGTSYVASTVALPTTTVISTPIAVLFQWRTSAVWTATNAWYCVAVA